jgi:hypothetical protein
MSSRSEKSRAVTEKLNLLASLIGIGLFLVPAILALTIATTEPSLNIRNLPSPVKEILQLANYIRGTRIFIALPWLLVAGLSMTSAFLLVRYLRELQKATQNKRRFQKTLQNLSNYGFEFHKGEAETLAAAIIAIETRSALTHSAKPLFTDMCTFVADTFNSITNCDCHCTIKVFEKTGSRFLVTEARDMLPYNRRRGTTDADRPLIDYKRDTGFASIIDRPDVDFFICNDLRTMAARGEYINPNSGWNDRYNSTIIAPVCLDQAASTINRDNCWGFIAVDSKDANFPSDISRDLLRIYSLQIRTILNIIASATMEKTNDKS